jgi:predicted RNA-binding protein YlqC (UPF0109 family)
VAALVAILASFIFQNPRFKRLILWDVDSPQHSRSPSPSGQDALTLRALVSTKDAGVIIGKGGKNVAELRDQTGVKAGVSKVTPGVHDRVLTISGPVERVAEVNLFYVFSCNPFY